MVVIDERDKMTEVGLVCDDYLNNHSADLTCQYVGYKYAKEWGNVGGQGFENVPRWVLEKEEADQI